MAMSQKTMDGLRVVEAEAVPRRRLRRRYLWVKRTLDIIGSAVLLVVLFPIFLLAAFLVKVTSKGPVFYCCDRVGKDSRRFRFVKFRSMYVDADARLQELLKENEKEGPIFKMNNDPRITPLGRIFRKYSIDEMPQLVHVLFGQMSLVGPRPPLPREVEQYDDYARHRLSVKPGLTCYWQISGRSNLSFMEWMDLDHRYIREMSLWTDLKILFSTPMCVIRGKGAF